MKELLLFVADFRWFGLDYSHRIASHQASFNHNSMFYVLSFGVFMDNGSGNSGLAGWLTSLNHQSKRKKDTLRRCWPRKWRLSFQKSVYRCRKLKRFET